jgi:hypothetical protein
MLAVSTGLGMSKGRMPLARARASSAILFQTSLPQFGILVGVSFSDSLFESMPVHGAC